MKLPNFVSPSADSLSKIGRHFSNKVVLKLKSAKNAFYKKGALKLIFINEKFFLKDSDDFWHRKFTLKVQNWHFLTNCPQMETQNLVISFDYSWFLVKNLAYAECRIMKFHYRNSSIFYLSPSHEHIGITIFFKAHEKITGKENFWKKVENFDFKWSEKSNIEYKTLQVEKQKYSN